MDEQAVRQHAQATCDALLAGDIGKAAEEMSKELRSSLGLGVSHQRIAQLVRQGR